MKASEKKNIKFPYAVAYNKCVIVPFEEDEKVGGIWIPDSAKRSLNQGIVIATGKDCNLAKIDMVVIFELHTESRIQIDREWFFILDETNILAFSDEKALGLDKV